MERRNKIKGRGKERRRTKESDGNASVETARQRKFPSSPPDKWFVSVVGPDISQYFYDRVHPRACVTPTSNGYIAEQHGSLIEKNSNQLTRCGAVDRQTLVYALCAADEKGKKTPEAHFKLKSLRG